MVGGVGVTMMVGVMVEEPTTWDACTLGDATGHVSLIE